MRLLLTAIAIFCSLLPQVAFAQAPQTELSGRWQVKFTFAGRDEMNLIFDSHDRGSGSFLLLDTAPEARSESSTRSAAWVKSTDDQVSFSGEVELPIGDCCRETGTLIFKGKFRGNNLLSGKVIFVGSTEDEENPIGFRAMIGSFTATRLAAASP